MSTETQPFISQEKANELLDLLTAIMTTVDVNSAISITKQSAYYKQFQSLQTEMQNNPAQEGDDWVGKEVKLLVDDDGENEVTGAVKYATTLFVVELEGHDGDAYLYADMGDWAASMVIQLDNIELVK